MPTSLRYSRFMFYEQDYLVPRTASLLFVPIGTECLRTHVKRPQGWLTFISIPTLTGSLCSLLYNRVSECRPLYFDSHSAPGEEDLRVPHETIESRRDVPSVLSTVALHFFRSCLMPRGRENEIIMLRGAQVCRWAIVRIECILPDTKRFSLGE